MDYSLVVVPFAAAREIIGKRLSQAGFGVLYAADGEAALGQLRDRRFDLLVVDDSKSAVDGSDWLGTLRAMSDARIVVVSCFPTIAGCERAIHSGADRFLGMGADIQRLGQIGRELMLAPSRRAAAGRNWTREEARALGERELRGLLQRLLVDCRGNIAEIARRMNRDRSTIRYHLRRMNMLE